MRRSLTLSLLVLLLFSVASVSINQSQSYQFPLPEILWNDRFAYGIDRDWDCNTGGFGIATNDSTVFYSSPYSLHIKSYSDSYAYAVAPMYKMISPNSNGSLCLLDYSQNYVVEFYFYLPTVDNHWIHVFKNQHILTVIDSSTDLKARWGGNNYLITSLNTSTWYRITYWVVPEQGKYYVDVYNVQSQAYVVEGFECYFHGEAFNRPPFLIGDNENGGVNYGEAYWDNISLWFNPVSLPKKIVFRLLAVEGFSHIGGNIPDDPHEVNSEYNLTEAVGNYSSHHCTDVPMRSAQYLIYALTSGASGNPNFPNWNNWTWAGYQYKSYIHLLSYSPVLLPDFQRKYYKGVSNKSNVLNEIQNFLGQNDPYAYTIRIFYYAGHAGKGQITGITWPRITNYWLHLGTGQDLLDYELDAALNSGALAQCKSTLIILDSCFSGGFITGPFSLSKKGRVILASSTARQKSWSWAWNPSAANCSLIPPCYWNWFTGSSQAWPPPPACPQPQQPPPPWTPIGGFWPNIGILGALFNATDTDSDNWLTAGEIFNYANSKTVIYSSSIGSNYTQNPIASYGVYKGAIPVVMIRNSSWISDPSTNIFKKVLTGFHYNAPPCNPYVVPPPPPIWWDMFRQNVYRTGVYPGIVKLGECLWDTQLLGSIRGSTAIADWGAVVGTENGTLFALDVRNGEILWNATLNETIFSSPAIMNGTVFVGTVGPPEGASLYALELSTGTIKWKYTFPPETDIFSSPAVTNGKVFIGTASEHLQPSQMFAFNQTTGEPLWNFTTETPLFSSPAIADDMVFFAEYGAPGIAPAEVWALNETTGKPIWGTEIQGSSIVSTPAVADDMVFLGTRNSVPSASPSVIALHEHNGTLAWNFTTTGNISSSPAVDSGNYLVVVGDEAGFVYGLKETNGQLIWNEQLSSYPINMSSPAVSSNGLVFIGSTDGNIYCLNETNGQKIWNYTTMGELIASPALVENHVLIGSTDGKLYCFGSPFAIHNVAVTNVTVSPKTVLSGDLVNITYTVKNKGNVAEAFTVMIAYNTTEIWIPPLYNEPTPIYTQTLTLQPGASITKDYIWNTTDISTGNCTISVQALNGPYETNTTDNTYIDGTLTIGIHNVAVVDVDPWKTVVGQTYLCNVNVTVANEGDFTETFNVTIYANTTVIDTYVGITLTSGNSTTLLFIWNTTGFVKGNYTIWAYAWPVPGETDTADNNFTDSFVIVAMVGDITGADGWPDGQVNIRDVALVASKFGVNYPDPRYDPNCDLTGPTQGQPDGKIDIRDVALVASKFGQIDP